MSNWIKQASEKYKGLGKVSSKLSAIKKILNEVEDKLGDADELLEDVSESKGGTSKFVTHISDKIFSLREKLSDIGVALYGVINEIEIEREEE